MNRIVLALAAVCLAGVAHAQTSIFLGNYALQVTYALDPLGELGLEASAVTYARDRGTLFFVGDEGLGVVEISRTGATLGSMAFTWPAASTNNDAEGLAYLGGGTLVVAEERLQDAYRFDFVNGATAALENADFVSFGATVSNIGTEGISVDPRTGRFVTVKQASPQAVLEGTLSFAAPPGGGVSGLAPLFDPALLGLASLSDVQTLSPIDALAGQPAADNLLLLSLDSRKLVEVNRAGAVLSEFDLTPLTTQAIEGVTVDEKGVIYLVAESTGAAGSQSRLFVLTPVPEPAEYVLLLAGLAALTLRVRAGRRSR
jgi:uncharacterized protein YjiK